jgi:hypothetical protein
MLLVHSNEAAMLNIYTYVKRPVEMRRSHPTKLKA